MPRYLLPAVFLLLALPPALGQDDTDIAIQRPFLWEFQQADSGVTSYLFGTIHVNDPQITKLHPQIESAFESAGAVWFEIDFTKDAGTQTKAISLASGERLEDLVPPETVVRIDERVKKLSPLLSRTALPQFKVVMWPLVLANLEAQVKHLGVLPMDMQLMAAAREAEKKTGGLEDASRQLKPLTDLPLEQQVEFLNASLDVMDEDDAQGVRQLDNLVRLYAAGDEEALHEYLDRELNRPKVSEELKTLFVETLLLSRNRLMVTAIIENLQDAPEDVHFVAVGTAHLLGEGSVVEGLREAGFTVRRVPVDDSQPENDDTDE